MKKQDLKNLIKEVIRESQSVSDPDLSKLGFVQDESDKNRFLLDLAKNVKVDLYFDAARDDMEGDDYEDEDHEVQLAKFSQDYCDVGFRIDKESDGTYISSIDITLYDDGNDMGFSERDAKTPKEALKKILKSVITRLKKPLWQFADDTWVDLKPITKHIANLVKKIK